MDREFTECECQAPATAMRRIGTASVLEPVCGECLAADADKYRTLAVTSSAGSLPVVHTTWIGG